MFNKFNDFANAFKEKNADLWTIIETTKANDLTQEQKTRILDAAKKLDNNMEFGSKPKKQKKEKKEKKPDNSRGRGNLGA